MKNSTRLNKGILKCFFCIIIMNCSLFIYYYFLQYYLWFFILIYFKCICCFCELIVVFFSHSTTSYVWTNFNFGNSYHIKIRFLLKRKDELVMKIKLFVTTSKGFTKIFLMIYNSLVTVIHWMDDGSK